MDGNELETAGMMFLYSLYLRLKARQKYRKDSNHFVDKILRNKKSTARK